MSKIGIFNQPRQPIDQSNQPIIINYFWILDSDLLKLSTRTRTGVPCKDVNILGSLFRHKEDE